MNNSESLNSSQINVEKINSVIEKLEALEIKRILIVDDTTENIQMAKKYFDNFPIQIDYANSQKQATEMIEKAYNKEKYDLVLTDLEMEEKKSGEIVATKALYHQALPYIVTGINYDRSHHESHGPTTSVLFYKSGSAFFNVELKKNEEGVWEKLFENILKHSSEEGSPLRKSLQRYNKYIGKVLDPIF